MRQRHWLDLMKDYDCTIDYHSGKANVVADALSQKSHTLTLASLTTSEHLIEEAKKVDLKLLVEGVTMSLSTLMVQPNLVDKITAAQVTDAELHKLIVDCKEWKQKDPDFSLIEGGILKFEGRFFFGFQDTLWDAKGRHYFKNCLIEGVVDCTWGNGQSIYIYIYMYAYNETRGQNSANDNSGFVFKAGRVFGNGNEHTDLGRAYGAYSRVIWYGTKVFDVKVPEGGQA
ncbi:probable pectinesterase 29 [Macadamia integrifolia]|uniref:probable pectinesterase 29 n=1 Tax=Macadamia integrifolia TaxID=60698 RepID=UPI001C4F5D58|nr:probable pectinesterase 29 [Macadamia integrifolia]